MEEKLKNESEEWKNIVLDDKLNRRVLDTMIAERMIVMHKDKAHLMVLMNLHNEEAGGKISNIDWRTILKLIDEIQGENKCMD
jgi:hypothetical protein